jgi:hypothetical protein
MYSWRREFQHPSGRFQAEQAVQATDMESGSVVVSRDVQLLQGIDPRLSRRLARRQKFSTTSFIQSLFNKHLVARIKNPLIPTSRVQRRKLKSEEACIDAQHGTKGLVSLGTQGSFILRLIAGMHSKAHNTLHQIFQALGHKQLIFARSQATNINNK